MDPQRFLDLAVIPAMSLMPARIDSPDAHGMLVAIALQETGLLARHQFGGGPARSYFQFELPGVSEALWNPSTQRHMERVCAALDLSITPAALQTALEFHDIAAVCCARLLLWARPEPVAPQHDEDAGWRLYVATWKPGAVTHGGARETQARARWTRSWTTAWAVVGASS